MKCKYCGKKIASNRRKGLHKDYCSISCQSCATLQNYHFISPKDYVAVVNFSKFSNFKEWIAQVHVKKGFRVVIYKGQKKSLRIVTNDGRNISDWSGLKWLFNDVTTLPTGIYVATISGKKDTITEENKNKLKDNSNFGTDPVVLYIADFVCEGLTFESATITLNDYFKKYKRGGLWF